MDPSVERGNMCPFCHTELLPVPPLSDTGSDSGRDSPSVSPTRVGYRSIGVRSAPLNRVFGRGSGEGVGQSPLFKTSATCTSTK